MAKNNNLKYLCDSCGYDSVKWYGKCPSCGQWDTLKEFKVPTNDNFDLSNVVISKDPPVKLSEITKEDEIRYNTGINEFDRVLGGGAVKGSLVLIGGEPGIGKSTLMLQICDKLSNIGSILYASGEESKHQIKLRAQRLGSFPDNLYIMPETNLDLIIHTMRALQPTVLVVDSIQTVYKSGLSAAPGNITQIRECAMILMREAKNSGCIIFLVGHVNKDGEIAGPKILEHMVDCVLYFEGERLNENRILRTAKNRFGPSNEIGVFEMRKNGLIEVTNPSAVLLAERPTNVPGTCITAVMEGTRPILAEIQALVSPTVFGNPRRVASGFDYNRAVLLLAILEKITKLPLGNCDVYINVVGGLKIDEPVSDLATIIAIASSFYDKPVISDALAIGEVGLTGELRRVSSIEQRLAEASRMKISRCICPYNFDKDNNPHGNLDIVNSKNITEAIAVALGKVNSPK